MTWGGKEIAVVIPAFREARLIATTLAGIPAFVDRIVVVDDASDDDTARIVASNPDPRIELIVHPVNRGVGAAIVSGYQRALERGADVLVVMAGDNQMDPTDFEGLIAPVVVGHADYVKGNRFIHADARHMPFVRRLGGRALSFLTRKATRLAVSDTQCGYTALSAAAARQLSLKDLWPRFGYPNDLLGMLAARGLHVSEVAVRPVYRDEQSGIRPWHVLTIAALIVRRRVLEPPRRQPRPDRTPLAQT